MIRRPPRSTLFPYTRSSDLNILGFAGNLGMDTQALRTCVETDKYKNAVQTDVMEAMRIGANGTPTFVVGKSTPEGDRKSTRLNSSHSSISYAVFCLKKKKDK